MIGGILLLIALPGGIPLGLYLLYRNRRGDVDEKPKN